ncbi:MAG TPA: 16S rRNA (uracil(1498)-N(3))-methyltransferase [Pseudomonadales bacterium]|nr:16S rRNA (uracil(1498)-N(3))-methyltransferase [Pseudomonadales bacterium]
MRISRLYSSVNLPRAGRINLDDDASHYLLKVLRSPVGYQFVMFDGSGVEYDVELVEATKKSATVDILSVRDGLSESPLASHLAIGISKGDRMDFVLQKATELGVTEITPLFTEHGDVKLSGDRLEKKMQHWLGVIRSACEQCGRSVLPRLHAPLRFEQLLSNETSEIKLVLYPTSHEPLREIQTPKSACLLIGPEGGLSQREIDQSLHAGFTSLQIGPRVLRTETAPIAALSLLQYLWGDI